ncbi:MAG: hypothetical protein HY040_08830 [Planctomycetes bacterium]|nr:hypothetical protein [Planctomycetota bacterium]
MSAGPDPQIDVTQIEQARRQINRLAEEIAQLSDMDLSPPEYYGEFLQRLLQAIAAPAGAVWVRTSQGNLQLQYQVNMHQVGLDKSEHARPMHAELLRHAASKGSPLLVAPNSSSGQVEGTKIPPGNPTDYVILLAPILYDKQVAGLVEIWQDANRGQDAQRGFLQFAMRMAGLAASFTRAHQLRQMVGLQQVWEKLEAFAKKIHASLNPLEVSYLVANEGRRLVEADRISVAVRQGSKPQVLAISGADVVEKRSNLVQLMRALFEAVMNWGEKLVHSGATRDEALPPAVHKALDAYLAESNSQLLVVLPLEDEREKKKEKKKFRSGLMMECFETSSPPEFAVERLQGVGQHAASALYNASEYRRIPMRFVWLPLAKLQDGLGGKAKAIWTLSLAAFTVLVLAMIFVPYPLKMEAHGQEQTKLRANVYAPEEGTVTSIPVTLKPGVRVYKGQELFRLYSPTLAKTIQTLQGDIERASATIRVLGGKKSAENIEVNTKITEAVTELNAKQAQLESIKQKTNSLDAAGEFRVLSPLNGIILSNEFRETLVNRTVKPNEPLMKIGFTNPERPDVADWEILLKIPQKHIGQVMDAFRTLKTDELDIDFIPKNDPTSTYRGKLKRNKVSPEATPNRDDNNEPDPVVLAWVRISGDGIPESSRIPASVLQSGIDVTARVRCGTRAMGYSLFYGVWEFIYEKILFFF